MYTGSSCAALVDCIRSASQSCISWTVALHEPQEQPQLLLLPLSACPSEHSLFVHIPWRHIPAGNTMQQQRSKTCQYTVAKASITAHINAQRHYLTRQEVHTQCYLRETHVNVSS
jgi:hypothetical protein